MGQFHANPRASEVLEGLATNPVEAILRLARSRAATARKRTPRRAAVHALDDLPKAYRYELAALLGRYAMHLHFADPFWSGMLHRSTYTNKPLRVASPRDIQSEKEGLDRLPRHIGTTSASYLDAIRYPPVHNTLDVSLMAMALFPHDNVAIIAGLEYLKVSRWNEARDMIMPVIEKPSSSLNRSIAWEALGAWSLWQGKLSASTEAYRNSADCEGDRPAPLATWLVLSACIDRRGEAEEAASRLDEMTSEDNLGVQACISAFQRLEERGVFKTSIKESGMKRTLHGPASKRIFDALP